VLIYLFVHIDHEEIIEVQIDHEEIIEVQIDHEEIIEVQIGCHNEICNNYTI